MPNLQKSLLSQDYRKRLCDALAIFSAFCASSGIPWQSYREDGRRMEVALITFIQHCCDKKLSLSLARHSILAVQKRFRSLKGRLRRAWDSIAAWQLQRPVKSRPPMGKPVMEAIFSVAMLFAFELRPGQRAYWVSFGLCIWIGWFGLLRPKEIFNLLLNHIRLPSRVLKGEPLIAVLRLLSPKNRAMIMVKNLLNLIGRRFEYERQTIYRRTDHSCIEPA